MTRKTRRDRDIVARFAVSAAQSCLVAGVATLTGLGLTACGQTTSGATLPDGSAGTGGTPTGGSGGATSGGGGAGAGPTAPRLWLMAVTAGNGVYVAAATVDGDFGTDTVILSSEDGKSWSLRFRGGHEEVDSVAYGGGHWIAAGWGVKEVGADYIRSRSVLVSDDAITWRAIQSPESQGFHEVIWTGSEFLMTGERLNDWALWGSPDGVVWTERLTGNIPGDLTKGAPGIAGSRSAALVFTDDGGVTWSSTGIEPAEYVLGLWPDGSGFAGTGVSICCFGEHPEENRYYSMHSPNGRVWNLQSAADPIGVAVAQIGATWVGKSVAGALLYRDAETTAWTTSPVGPPFVRAVTAGDRFVAVGPGIWSSDDGKTWTEGTLPAELPGS